MKPVALVGLPGCGKSTVARQLARRWNCGVVDTDELIEQRLGEPIRSYFEREGEPAFRAVETTVLDGVLAEPAGGLSIVSTGGGIVLSETNRHLLRDRAIVVYLVATPDELARRLRHDTKRPLLQVADPLSRLRDLLRVRDPLYRETAAFCIDAGRLGLRSLVGLVQMQLELSQCVQGIEPHESDRDPSSLGRPQL